SIDSSRVVIDSPTINVQTITHCVSSELTSSVLCKPLIQITTNFRTCFPNETAASTQTSKLSMRTLPHSDTAALRENEPTIRGAIRMLYRYWSPPTQSVTRTGIAKADASSISNLNSREISRNKQAPRNRVTTDCFWAQD